VAISASGSGTMTQLNTTAPLVGGPITTSGTVSCPTCTTNASALLANKFMTGDGLQASKTPASNSGIDTSGNATFNSITLGGAPSTTCTGTAGCFEFGQGTAPAA